MHHLTLLRLGFLALAGTVLFIASISLAGRWWRPARALEKFLENIVVWPLEALGVIVILFTYGGGTNLLVLAFYVLTSVAASILLALRFDLAGEIRTRLSRRKTGTSLIASSQEETYG